MNDDKRAGAGGGDRPACLSRREFLLAGGAGAITIALGQVAAHREWMIRAYAIGLGVGTIRLLVGPLLSLSGRPFHEIFGIAFWIAFALHLLVAEIWIRFTRSRSGQGASVAHAG